MMEYVYIFFIVKLKDGERPYVIWEGGSNENLH